MLSLIATIALQSMHPTYCYAVFAKEQTAVVKCSCGYTAKSLKKRTCASTEAPKALELKEIEELEND